MYQQIAYEVADAIATITLDRPDKLNAFTVRMQRLVPEAASSWFLPRVVGISQAMEWCATGRLFLPDEALGAGLIGSVHEPDELLPAAYELGREIADNTSATSVTMTRAMLWHMLGAPTRWLRTKSTRRITEWCSSPDFRRAPSASCRSAGRSQPVPADLPEFLPLWEDPDF